MGMKSVSRERPPFPRKIVIPVPHKTVIPAKAGIQTSKHSAEIQNVIPSEAEESTTRQDPTRPEPVEGQTTQEPPSVIPAKDRHSHPAKDRRSRESGNPEAVRLKGLTRLQ